MTAGNGRRRIRAGVAGTGFGAAVHVPALQGLDDVDVVGLYGRTMSRVRDAAERLSVSDAVDDVDQLLALGLDVLTVALPPKLNNIVVMKALDLGIAVLCEKPLSASAASAVQLAAATAGRPCAVDFQFAELDAFRVLRDRLQEGSIGDVRQVSITWLVESWAMRNAKWSWKTDAVQGGGVLGLLGSHLFYLLEWLFGRVDRIWAQADDRVTRCFSPEGAAPAPDHWSLHLQHTSGPHVSIDLGNAAPGLHRHHWYVIGDAASLELVNATPDYMSGFQLLRHPGAETLVAPRETDEKDGRIAPFQSLVRRFLDNHAEGSRGDWPSIEDAARVQVLMSLAGHSAAKNAWMTMPEDIRNFS